MATRTAPEAAVGAVAPANSVGAGNTVLVQAKALSLATARSAADIDELFLLPKGAVVVFGYLGVTDIDSGTETLEIDLGIKANGVDSADPDLYVNSGVIDGDAATDSNLTLTNLAEVRLVTPANFNALRAKTVVTATTVAAANAGGTGTLVVVLFYTTPGSATS